MNCLSSGALLASVGCGRVWLLDVAIIVWSFCLMRCQKLIRLNHRLTKFITVLRDRVITAD